MFHTSFFIDLTVFGMLQAARRRTPGRRRRVAQAARRRSPGRRRRRRVAQVARRRAPGRRRRVTQTARRRSPGRRRRVAQDTTTLRTSVRFFFFLSRIIASPDDLLSLVTIMSIS